MVKYKLIAFIQFIVCLPLLFFVTHGKNRNADLTYILFALFLVIVFILNLLVAYKLIRSKAQQITKLFYIGIILTIINLAFYYYVFSTFNILSLS